MCLECLSQSLPISTASTSLVSSLLCFYTHRLHNLTNLSLIRPRFASFVFRAMSEYHFICEIVGWLALWGGFEFYWKIMNNDNEFETRFLRINRNSLKSKITSWYVIFLNNIHNNISTSLYPCRSLIWKWSTRIKAKSWYKGRKNVSRGCSFVVDHLHCASSFQMGSFVSYSIFQILIPRGSYSYSMLLLSVCIIVSLILQEVQPLSNQEKSQASHTCCEDH